MKKIPMATPKAWGGCVAPMCEPTRSKNATCRYPNPYNLARRILKVGQVGIRRGPVRACVRNDGVRSRLSPGSGLMPSKGSPSWNAFQSRYAQWRVDNGLTPLNEKRKRGETTEDYERLCELLTEDGKDRTRRSSHRRSVRPSATPPGSNWTRSVRNSCAARNWRRNGAGRTSPPRDDPDRPRVSAARRRPPWIRAGEGRRRPGHHHNPIIVDKCGPTSSTSTGFGGYVWAHPSTHSARPPATI